MRRDEWQRAFGGTPEVLERRVQDTLNNLQEEKKVKRKLSVTISIALAAVLALTGTAFAVANGMGIVDFMSRFGEVPAQIGEVIEEAQGDGVSTSRVKYTAQEVVFNGDTVQMTVVCEPMDPEHVVLLGVDELEEDLRMANGDSVPSTYETDDPSWMTVKEYAEQNGLEMVRAEASIGLNGASADYVSRDGRLYYYMRGTFEQDARPELGEDGKYHLKVAVVDRLCEDEQVEREELDVAVAGKAAQDKSVLAFAESIDMGAYTIDGIEISVSKQETALNLRYTVKEDLTEAEQWDMESLTFTLMKDDVSAEEIDGWGGGAKPLGEADNGGDMSGQSFLMTRSYDSLEEMPEHFYIRPYNYDLGEYGKLIVLSTADGVVEVKDAPVAAVQRELADSATPYEKMCEGMEAEKANGANPDYVFQGPFEGDHATIYEVWITLSEEETLLNVWYTLDGESLMEDANGLVSWYYLMQDAESLEPMETQRGGSAGDFSETYSFAPLKEIPENFYLRSFNERLGGFGETVITLPVAEANP
ncbi:MAG: hypothetical protein Q4E13_13455 [Clostridia bacterium]|nr:hypothetical protein [Clostridia bacterium]